MELLTVQETAQMLKVAPITVRRYIAAGRLPAVKVGRGVRLERRGVERFLTPIERPSAGATVLDAVEPTSEDDPLWNIVGMFDSGPDGPTDVSANKHKYLAEAYADLHDE